MYISVNIKLLKYRKSDNETFLPELPSVRGDSDRNLNIWLYKKYYENTPMQHTAIFHARKNDNFHLKMFDCFLIFAQNIDYGYTLEPPQ